MLIENISEQLCPFTSMRSVSSKIPLGRTSKDSFHYHTYQQTIGGVPFAIAMVSEALV
jgi:hypothetical protein